MAAKSQHTPSFSPGRKWGIGFSVLVGLAATLAIVVMLNYISRNFFFRRMFLSSQTRIELSAQTLSLLKSVTNNVKVTLYYDKEEPMFTTVAALVNEYHLHNPKITVNTVDYTRDTAGAQAVKTKYKDFFTAPTDKDLVIFDCNNHVRVVNGDALAEYSLESVPNKKEPEYLKKPVAFKGEMMFSAILRAVINPKPLLACYLVGHGEREAQKEDDQMGYMKFISVVQQNYLQVAAISLLGTNTVPAECSVLIIAGPQSQIPDVELDKIEKYLESGGRLFALFDCTSVNKELGLEKLLARWGVDVTGKIIQDDDNSLRGQDILISRFSKHPVVNALLNSRIHVILPRAVSRIDSATTAADAPKVEELAFTGPKSIVVGQTNLPPRSYSVAVAVEKGAVTGVTSERGTTRIVVTGDSLFLGNQMIDSAGNRDFASYALNWLLDRTEMLQGLGPRPVKEFTVVMTRTQMKSAELLLLIALPGAVLLTGFLVWLRRRS